MYKQTTVKSLQYKCLWSSNRRFPSLSTHTFTCWLADKQEKADNGLFCHFSYDTRQKLWNYLCYETKSMFNYKKCSFRILGEADFVILW